MDLKSLKGFNALFLLPTALGAFPFVTSTDRFYFSIPFITYGLLLRTTFGFECFLLIQSLKHNKKESDGRFYFETQLTNISLTYVFTVVSYICLLRMKKWFASLIQSCVEVEKSFVRIWNLRFNSYNYTYDIAIFCVVIVSVVLNSIVAEQLTVKIVGSILYNVYLFSHVYMSVYPFVRIVDFIQSRFAGLKVIFPQIIGLDLDPDKRAKLVAVVQLHNLLCSKSRILNKCFNIQLLFLYFIGFCNIVTNCYYVSDDIFSNEHPVFISIKGTIVVFYSLVCYWVTNLCKSASCKASEFNDLVYQIMMDDKSQNISTDKKLRLHISMKREVLFTACGFFNIDNTLVHSIIAATTTYLVILIQSGDPAASDASNMNAKETALSTTQTYNSST